jgi:site-specific recombinase XerD
MKLHAAVTQYIAYKHSLGMKFVSDGRILKSFARLHGNKDLKAIGSERVMAFLDGKGPLTSFWHRKHCALSGFYRFAIARRYTGSLPLPRRLPKLPHRFVPHIYSHGELKRLMEAIPACFENHRCRIDVETYRTLLLLLYGAALRISEAVSLTLGDVDLDAAVLKIRDSKFHRTRLVPIGADLASVLTQHLTRRRAQNANTDAPLFVRRAGTRLTRAAAENAFCRLRVLAKVLRHDGSRYQPRLHDLRHSSATYRLLSWYQSGADVQRLLPKLATFLGHIHISGTQRYLTLTPQLLQKASQRFERYAFGGCHE